jgi:hypothetical protein
VKAPRPAPPDEADELAEIEEMIARLRELRQRTQDRALLGAYQAALDRLDALAYRLQDSGAQVIGLPPAKPIPEPAPLPAHGVARRARAGAEAAGGGGRTAAAEAGRARLMRCALDDFGGRVSDDRIEALLRSRPHPDAVFDAMWWSRHTLDDRPPLSAWRFVYACTACCPDAVGSMPASRDPDSHPPECPDCGGPVERLRRCLIGDRL